MAKLSVSQQSKMMVTTLPTAVASPETALPRRRYCPRTKSPFISVLKTLHTVRTPRLAWYLYPSESRVDKEIKLLFIPGTCQQRKVWITPSPILNLTLPIPSTDNERPSLRCTVPLIHLYPTNSFL